MTVLFKCEKCDEELELLAPPIANITYSHWCHTCDTRYDYALTVERVKEWAKDEMKKQEENK